MTGWGAHLGQMQISGVWSRDLALRNTYYLEMMAVLFCHSILSRVTEGSKGGGQDGQHHCNDLHQQTRGDAFSIPMHSGMEHVPVSHQDCLNCSTYSGKS